MLILDMAFMSDEVEYFTKGLLIFAMAFMSNNVVHDVRKRGYKDIVLNWILRKTL